MVILKLDSYEHIETWSVKHIWPVRWLFPGQLSSKSFRLVYILYTHQIETRGEVGSYHDTKVFSGWLWQNTWRHWEIVSLIERWAIIYKTDNVTHIITYGGINAIHTEQPRRTNIWSHVTSSHGCFVIEAVYKEWVTLHAQHGLL